ncbi:septal ring lytic transglycosylase RlpA family protein [Helicobacter anatolicus]|uniref:septal ring lytic transglycosylase RlpA family protein n=1 Tax=Helicobacter anatolicus TaxID=2905874 RepID=UPI0022B8DF86|nr:septal ring lytic transglycosylase RlpA family protein [Helicobacter anatolicus]
MRQFSSFLCVVAFFLGCAPQSSYKGGVGAFKEYEGYKEWKKRGYTANYANQSYSDYKASFEGGNIPTDLFNKDSSMMVGMRESTAIQRATMRPYKIAGKWYYPSRVDIGDIFDGIASWYGPNFHDKKTSNGETYNMHAHTAASKTLPMNTIVKVQNKENGKITIVRINDRGPFVDGRIIDLSNVAAHDIDMVDKGTAQVRLEVIGFGGMIAQNYEKKFQKDLQKSSSQLSNEFRVGASEEVFEGGDFALQVGVFKKEGGAKEIQERYSEDLKNSPNYKAEIQKDGDFYRVFVRGFKSEDEASDFGINKGLEHPIIIRE